MSELIAAAKMLAWSICSISANELVQRRCHRCFALMPTFASIAAAASRQR